MAVVAAEELGEAQNLEQGPGPRLGLLAEPG